MYMYIERMLILRLALYTPYSARMSPENTHKLMGFYMEGFNTRRYTLVHGFCFFNPLTSVSHWSGFKVKLTFHGIHFLALACILGKFWEFYAYKLICS